MFCSAQLNVVQLLQLGDAWVQTECVCNREVRGCGAIDAPVQVWVDHSAGSL